MVIETAKVVDPKARLSEAHRRLRLVQQASLGSFDEYESVETLPTFDQDEDQSYMCMGSIFRLKNKAAILPYRVQGGTATGT